MASQEDISKYFTGTHEVQECAEGQGEADLHTQMAHCKKTPGHLGFIPVNRLTNEHFPSGYHDNDLYKFTKAVADLTVRIAVKFTSPDRPEFIPGTQDPYPFYNSRGTSLLRTGTGRVCELIKDTEGTNGSRHCPCPECEHSATPSKVWWVVHVVTAKHVVYDTSEARQSSCRLWFDRERCPKVNIYGREVPGSNVDGDLCMMFCWTHDTRTADKLDEMLGRYEDLCAVVRDKYESRRDVDKLTIIVSHPHGCSKQVSVGHWVHRQEVGMLKQIRYSYTACTCPGSSGAQVYRVGWGWSAHTHSGANANSGGLNYSGLAGDTDW
ncbi:uncharacterized protein LOC131941435 isoform X2 [Physella acuta]|nr:uncharacterized protein LOC131941435 isoform X2 [Physella acuta]